MKPHLLFLACAHLALAQESPFPELRVPMDRFSAGMKAAADGQASKREKVNAEYAAVLDTIFKQLAATGDLDATVQAKTEKEHLLAGTPLAAASTLPPPLRAAREKYERALEPLATERTTAENAARQRYLAELEQLQKALTQKTEIDKALTVKAERERIAKDMKPLASTPANAVTAAAPGVSFQMRGFFEQLTAGTSKPRILKNTLSKGDRGKPYQDLPKEGAFLVGFEITMGDWFGAPILHSIQPIYLGLRGKFRGEVYGTPGHHPVTLEARDGYAVSGLTLQDGSLVGSLQLTYMKIDALHRRLDKADSYQSDLIGVPERHKDTKAKTIGNDGNPIIGIFGAAGGEINSIAIIEAP